MLNLNMEASLLAIFIVGTSFLILKDIRSRIISITATFVALALMELNKHYPVITPILFEPATALMVHYTAILVIVLLSCLTIVLYIWQNDQLVLKLKSTTRNLKEHAIELERTNEALAKANLTKSIFLRETSHEIRNPLNAIFGISQLLMMEMDKTEQLKPISKLIIHLHAASYNVTQIINNVLELSKLEAGVLDDVRKDPFSIQEWISNIIHIYQYVADLKGVKIELEINLDIPERMISDKVKLTQIVNNLLINAIKFTKDNSVINVLLYPENDQWSLAVSDQGAGIPEEMMHNIFDPFVTEQGAFIDGTGLGLPIAKRLTQLLYGEITVQRNENGGSTFIATFPMEEHVQPPAPPETNFLQEDVDYSDKVILVVEDNMMNQMVFSNFLSRSRCKLIMADNGQQALEKARLQTPDLILLDMHMPVMDGYETLVELKKDPILKNVPVVAISADSFKEAVDEVMQAGANDYVLKPVQFRPLYEVVGKYLKPQPAFS
jgi:signal transduction histidine kinase